MASFVKMPDGKWRALVARKGVRKSKVFTGKQAARDWAAGQEHSILNGDKLRASMLFSEACLRYSKEVSPLRKGERWERLRLAAFARGSLGGTSVSDLSPSDLARWRDDRLLSVKPASVAREMNLISSVLTQCRKEWGIISTNPIADVRKPKKPPPRTRTATDGEMEALALSAGHDLSNATARAFHAFLFACQTAMRAGEITALRASNVFMQKRYVHVPISKNGHPRDVPLSSEAIRILEDLPKNDFVFDLDPKSLDALWRKLRDRAAVKDLRFHDSRRMATVLLSKKLQPLELAKVTGHRDLNMLLNTYYKAEISEIVDKLD